MLTALKKPTAQPDYAFLSIVVVLVIFGLVMLASASSDLGKAQFDDSFYYVTHQLMNGLAVGIAGFVVGAFVSYRWWEKLSLPLLLVSLVFLILVFTPLGVSVKGSDRWLDLGIFTFQPSEFLKLTFFVYLSAWISKNQTRSKSFSEGFVPFLILLGGVMTLLLMQPATSIAFIIFAAAVLTYFTAGAKVRFLLGSALVAAVAFSLVIYMTPYRLKRVTTFLNPETDQLGGSYHINQALIAIGSGGLTGVGFGKSTTKLSFLPEPIGDSIFAVIAEELGFIGAGFVVLMFLMLMWRGLSIARASPDTFGRLLATSFVSLISVQAFINMAAISNVIPLTGVPLPFISFGGTALAVFLTMCGIIINISRYKR